MKRIIFLLLFVGGSIFANAQPFTNIQANQSGLSVRTNLNNMINYINALGLKIEYSTDGVTWNYPWQNGNIYTRFSGDYGTNWTPKMFMWDGSVLGSIEADTLKIGTDVITGFSNFLTFADTTSHLATKYNLSQLGVSGAGIIYDISAQTATGGANLRLSGTDNSTDDVKFAGSGATTVTRTDANTITISSTDNNTTYTAGTGLSLAGTTFNHSNAVTAGSFGPGSNATLTWGGTFTVPSGAYDAQGHLTGATNRTMTMPANPNTTYAISAENVSGGANLSLTGSDASTDNVKLASGWGIDFTRTDENTITAKADTTRLATQYDLTQISAGGGTPGGSGTELQYRSGAATFGAVTGSSVSGGSVTLGSRMNITTNSTDWGQVITNNNASGLGLAILAGTAGTILTANSSGGNPRFEVGSNGAIYMHSLSNASTANTLYYNTSTGLVTYGAAGGGGSSPLTTKGDIYTFSTGDTRLPVGTNGQILSANSATSTGLQWINPPSGSSQWTTDTYGITYSAGNVGIGAASQSNAKLYVAGVSGYAAYLSNTNSGSGMGMFVRSDVNNENYPNTILNYGGVYNMFVFQNNGHMAQREVLGAVPTAPTNYGYWYVSGGKPYFKYGSTAYDLTAGTGGGPDLTVQSLSGTSVTWNVTNGVNAKITISGNTTITMSNLSAGSSGNLTVTNPSTPYTLTFSGYTFKVSPYVYRAANSPYLSGGSKLDVFSWYYDGTTVFINGTQDYK